VSHPQRLHLPEPAPAQTLLTWRPLMRSMPAPGRTNGRQHPRRADRGHHAVAVAARRHQGMGFAPRRHECAAGSSGMQGWDLRKWEGQRRPSGPGARPSCRWPGWFPDHAEGLPPIPQVSLIPFKPFPQFDPTVPPCILR